MSSYAVQRPIRFEAGSHSRSSAWRGPRQLQLEPGDVVLGVSLHDVTARERADMQRAERRHAQEQADRREAGATPTRLGYFRAWGVVRYAEVGRDLLPSRKAPTVDPNLPEGIGMPDPALEAS